MRFVVIGDTKGKENGINEKVLREILGKTSRLNPLPRFIVICGDSVAGSDRTEMFSRQLEGLKALLTSYHKDIPVIPVVGNHEVNINSHDDRFERILSEFYDGFKPDDCLEGYNGTVYYLDCDYNTRIFVLNAFHCGEIHRISKRQLTWFEEKASQYKNNKIVFVHSPPFPTGAHLNHCLDLYPEDRDALWEVVDKSGIDIVISGHEHNYSRRVINSALNGGQKSVERSVCQVITGGGGEKLRDKFKSREGVVVPPINKYHFLVVDTETNYIRIAAISSKGKRLDEFEIKKRQPSQ